MANERGTWANKYRFVKNPLSRELRKKYFKSCDINTPREFKYEAEAIAYNAVEVFGEKHGFNDINKLDAKRLAGLYVDYRLGLDQARNPLIGCIEGLEESGLLATAEKLCAGVDADISKRLGTGRA